MSAVRRTSSTKLSGNATLFLQLDYGDTAAALGAQTDGGHVGMAFQEARDGLAQPALAEAVDDAHLVAVREQRLVERLVHPRQRPVDRQAHQVHLGRSRSGRPLRG